MRVRLGFDRNQILCTHPAGRLAGTVEPKPLKAFLILGRARAPKYVGGSKDPRKLPQEWAADPHFEALSPESDDSTCMAGVDAGTPASLHPQEMAKLNRVVAFSSSPSSSSVLPT